MRRAAWVVVVCAMVAASAAHAQFLSSGEARLQEARRLLTGANKAPDRAQKLLLATAQSASFERPETAVWTCIYLGYIEDRAGNRQEAVRWYQQGLRVFGASPSSREIAQSGTQKPLRWIRHLDEGTPVPSADTAAPPTPTHPPGTAYVTDTPPKDLKPATGLSAEQRRANFEAFWKLIDENYAHFKLKSIDWDEVGKKYRARLDGISGDEDFYLLLFQLVNELKDTHSWLDNYKVPPLFSVPDLPIDMFHDKPFVVSGPKAGWEVVAVNGKTVAERMEELRPSLRGFSSERAFRREAGRNLLAGERDEAVSVQLRSPEGSVETLSLRRGGFASRPKPRPLPTWITRQRFVHYGKHPSGLGYILIESFNGRQEIDQEFDRALEALRDAPGLILDIRDNPGGFGHPAIIGRLLTKRKLASVGYRKDGPGHNDLVRIESHLQPGGPWQYAAPIVLLVNDVTGSAADLFTTELRSAGRVTLVGTTTHGNLSGTATYAVLPCGLVARISNAYVADARNRVTEVNGNVPDVVVEPDVQDYLAGRDPVLDRAVEILSKRPAK